MAQQKMSSDVFAGIFLVVSLALFGLSIWVLGSEREIFSRQQTFRITFADVRGLNNGAAVRLGGIAIGRVSRIGFSSDLADARVHVMVLINQDFLDRVREDSVATIETQGLLGDKFISVSPGGSNKELPPGSTLKSRETGDFGAVLSKAEAVVQNTVEISESFKGLIAEIRGDSMQRFTETLQEVTKLAKEVETGDGLMHLLVYSKKDGDSIFSSLQTTADGLRDITQSVKDGHGIAHELLYGEKGDETVKTLRESFTQIGNASAQLAAVLQQAKTGNNALHKLLYSDSPDSLDALLSSLNHISANMKKATDALANGSGTLGALLFDSKVYDNLVDVTGDAKRSVILRGIIRNSLTKDKDAETSGASPAMTR